MTLIVHYHYRRDTRHPHKGVCVCVHANVCVQICERQRQEMCMQSFQSKQTGNPGIFKPRSVCSVQGVTCGWADVETVHSSLFPRKILPEALLNGAEHFSFQLAPKESQVRSRETKEGRKQASMHCMFTCAFMKNKKGRRVGEERFTVWSFSPQSAIQCSRLCVSGTMPAVSCPFHSVAEYSC